MSRPDASLPPDYFEAIYARDPDPWRFADSAYERAKYDASLAALERPHYPRALEVGCSIGVLTRDLAPRCLSLLALDAAAAPLEAARARCAGLPQVAFRQMLVPRDWPAAEPQDHASEAAPFDLILLSEVVYYLDAADVGRLAARVGAALAPGGEVLLVHWTGATDYPLSGDDATAIFLDAAKGYAAVRRQSREAGYRLDLLRAPG